MSLPVLPWRYTLIRPLGEGERGAVFLVEDKLMPGLQLALKIFKYFQSETLLKETQILTRLRHPNIVRVWDVGWLHKPRQPYSTMDYVCGESLEVSFKKNNFQEKLLITSQLVEALSYLHGQNVVHGDLKPSNILVQKEKNEISTKLVDFGFAFFSQKFKKGITGTPAYLAPEIIAQQKWDHRADLYALGVLLYQIFVGHLPFRAVSLSRLLKAHLEEIPTIPQTVSPLLPKPLQEMILKLLAKNPDERLQHASELWFFLTQLGLAKPVLSLPILSEPDSNSEWEALKLKAQVQGEEVFYWEASDGKLSGLFPALLRWVGQLFSVESAQENPKMEFQQMLEKLHKALSGFTQNRVLFLLGRMDQATPEDIQCLEFFLYAKLPDSFRFLFYYDPDCVRKKPFATLLHRLNPSEKLKIVARQQKQRPSLEEESVHPFARAKQFEEQKKWDEALRCYELSAQADLKLYQYTRAKSALEKAETLSMKVKSQKRGELLWQLIFCCIQRGEFLEAHQLLQRHHNLFKDFSSEERLSRELLLLQRLGKYKEAFHLFQQFSKIEKNLSESLQERWWRLLLAEGDYSKIIQEAKSLSSAKGILANTIGLAHFYLGNYIASRDWFKKGLQSKSPLVRFNARNYLGMSYYNQGRFLEAAKEFAKASSGFQSVSYPGGLLSVLMNQGVLFHAQAKYGEAYTHYEAALQIARQTQEVALQAILLNNLANLFVTLRQYVFAKTYLKEAKKMTETASTSLMIGYNDLIEGDLHAVEGNFEKSLQCMRQAIRQFEDKKSFRELSVAYFSAAKTAISANQDSEAKSFLDKALKIAREHQLMEQEQTLLVALAHWSVQFKKKMDEPFQTISQTASLETQWEGKYWQGKMALQLKDINKAKKLFSDSKKILMQIAANIPLTWRENYLKDPLKQDLLNHLEKISKEGEEPMQLNTFKRLLEINQKLTAELSSEKVLAYIMDAVVELTGAERGFLILADHLQIPVARNLDQEDIKKPKFKISRSIAERVLKNGNPLLTTDALEDPRFKAAASVQGLKLRSVMCVPMKHRGSIVGAIYVDNRYQTGVFREEDLEVMTALADQAAIAYVNATLHEETLQKQKELAQANHEIASLNQRLESVVAKQTMELDSVTKALQLKQKDLELKYQYKNIVGRSAPMQKLFQLLDRITDSEANVLIQGESGTGKELVARAIHFNGPRKNGPFISINCAAIPATLLESELFGHKKGAFTGAIQDKAGLFEQASEGTIFLDEMGEMPIEMQSKLLRVLEQKEVRRLGTHQTVPVNVRVIAATNRDLATQVANKQFREDLFYRLHVLSVHLPPLRERREDIPLLIDLFLRGRKKIEPQAMRLLLQHDWPGNVRQLENEIERSLVLGGAEIGAIDLSTDLKGGSTPTTKIKMSTTVGGNLKEARGDLEQQWILEAISKAGGNKAKAAKLLGLSRYGLYKKINRYKIVV